MTKGIKEERIYFDLTVPEGESIILGRHAMVESWKQKDHYPQ